MNAVADLSRTIRVLVADDYSDAAESIAMILEGVGVEACIAVDGEQALARANEWRPHVCVLDVDMPKLDGNEIARRIREQSWEERPLLIAMTGWVASANRTRALNAGFDHWVGKPFEPAQLVQLIRDYVAGQPG
jgi:CheY-like chemotaxis protein